MLDSSAPVHIARPLFARLFVEQIPVRGADQRRGSGSPVPGYGPPRSFGSVLRIQRAAAATVDAFTPPRAILLET